MLANSGKWNAAGFGVRPGGSTKEVRGEAGAYVVA